MSWRRIQIEGEKYRWTVGHHRLTHGYTEPPEDLLLTVVVRGAGDYKLLATFHGFALLDAWQKERIQNLAISPGLVRSLILYARERGLQRIEHAERIFPEAILPKEREQEFLRAARRQWFCDQED